MSRRNLRASGWSSAVPRVVGERAVETDFFDNRSAKTWVWRRTVFTVPDGPWPCQTCSEYLVPGSKARRSIVRGEAVYRHFSCSQSPTYDHEPS